MFTGLVQCLGKVESVSILGNGSEVMISAPHSLDDISEGDSISVNGVCSTALECHKNSMGYSFKAQYLEETLNKTWLSNLSAGQAVNLEQSLTPKTKIGGHFVSGHVDECGVIVTLQDHDPWGKIVVRFSPENRKYCIPKGSICLDGISLTIVELTDDTVSCHLIPHTIQHTILKDKKKRRSNKY
jgi:riboflavin synthase